MLIDNYSFSQHFCQKNFSYIFGSLLWNISWLNGVSCEEDEIEWVEERERENDQTSKSPKTIAKLYENIQKHRNVLRIITRNTKCYQTALLQYFWFYKKIADETVSKKIVSLLKNDFKCKQLKNL